MTFIAFSGLPGTGKSTVARRLAPRLGLPVLDKDDDFLDALFTERGVGEAEWRAALSREADERFIAAARQLTGACLVSWWRHRGAPARSGTPTEWLSTLSAPVVEVHCRCNVLTAVERFLNRQRHPAHLDNTRTHSSLLTAFAALDAGPLGIGPVIHIETEAEVDSDPLLRRIRATLASATHTSGADA